MNVVRVGGETGATGELLLTGGSDDDGLGHRAKAAGVERAHIEDIDTLHLTENLQTLQTGGLLEIGRDGTGLGTGTEEVVLSADLCGRILVSGRSVTMGGRPRLCMTRVEAVDGGIVETYPSESCRRRPSCRQSRRGQRPAPWGWQAWKPHLLENESQPSYDDRHWLDGASKLRTANKRGGEGASDDGGDGGAAGRGDGGSLQEHCDGENSPADGVEALGMIRDGLGRGVVEGFVRMG